MTSKGGKVILFDGVCNFCNSSVNFIIDKDKEKGTLKARQQFVRLGKSRGDFIEIADGLKAGEQVVSAGAFKLTNGQSVIISKTAQPDFKADPKPIDQ